MFLEVMLVYIENPELSNWKKLKWKKKNHTKNRALKMFPYALDKNS